MLKAFGYTRGEIGAHYLQLVLAMVAVGLWGAQLGAPAIWLLPLTFPLMMAFGGTSAVFFGMANCGLPGTAGFVGEWMVILGAVKFNFWIGLLSASALIFGAAYTLWMFKRVYLGPVVNDDVKELLDINGREFLMLALLAAAVLYMGVYPKPFTDVMDTSVADLLKHVALSKLP